MLLMNAPMVTLACWMSVPTLSTQMVANAKAAGDEIATLKMRVMEMEIGATVAMPGHP